MTAGEVVIKGVLFGLGAAMPIGPINVELARRALQRGWGHGVALGMGAVTVDVVYMWLAVAGLQVAAERPWVYWPLAIGGTGVLVYLGVGCLRAARAAMREGWTVTETLGPAPSYAKVYATGLAMTAVNPMTLVFWFGGLSSLSQGIEPGYVPYMATGVGIGAAAWVISFSTLMTVLGRWRKPWWMAAADLVGGIVLLGFAALSAWACIRRLGGGVS